MNLAPFPHNGARNACWFILSTSASTQIRYRCSTSQEWPSFIQCSWRMACLIDRGVAWLGWNRHGSSRIFSILHPRKLFPLMILYGTISDIVDRCRWPTVPLGRSWWLVEFSTTHRWTDTRVPDFQIRTRLTWYQNV